MGKNRTDQKRDEETGHWVSDLKPGATQEAKIDKGVEDTFPASDPVHKGGPTGFISSDGMDTAVHGNPAEQTSAAAASGLDWAGRAGGTAVAAVSQHPLAALFIAGAVGFVFGLTAHDRR